MIRAVPPRRDSTTVAKAVGHFTRDLSSLLPYYIFTYLFHGPVWLQPYVYIQINMTYVDTINIYVSIGFYPHIIIILVLVMPFIHFIDLQLLIKKYEKFILTSS